MIGNKSFVFRFSDVEVREHEFSLLKAGKVLAVEPKAFRILLLLLRNPQTLISKEELLNAVWGDTAVTEDGRFIYFQRSTDDRGIFRIPISGGDEERIVDLKKFRSMGWYTHGWLGLDPTDAPLLLRDTGTDEIYALTLEQK
jgi:hypothetical protein